jgi:PAS domain S-box-containing protein
VNSHHVYKLVADFSIYLRPAGTTQFNKIKYPKAFQTVIFMNRKPTYEELEKDLLHLRAEVTNLKKAQNKMQGREMKLRSILDNSIDAIWFTDLNNKVTFITPSCINIGGYTREEVMAFDNGLDLYDEKTKARITENMRHYLQQPVEELKRARIPTIEGKGIHKNGHKIWVEIQAKFVFDGDRLIGVQGATRNITVRKEFEQALEKNEYLLKQVIESTENAVLAVDQDGKIIASNALFYQMWQIPEEFMGETDVSKLRHFVLDQLEEPEAFLLKTRELYQSKQSDFDLLSFKDGRRYERYSRPMKKDGKYLGHVWSYRDITQKSQAEEKLKESEERYRTLVENLPVAVYQNTPGPEGRFLMVNPAFCRIFGYGSEEEVKRVKVADVYAKPEEREVFSDRLLDRGVIEVDERELLKKDGSSIWASVTASLREGKAGEPPHFDCILTDITEQKKLQTQLLQAQKMEALGRLAGGVAHDLNNILSGIVSYPDLLLHKLPQDSPLRKPVLTMQRSGEKAAALVQDLLTLARRGVMQSEVTCLNDIISDYLTSAEHHRFLTDYPGISVETRLSKSLLNISGSPHHLSKAVMNLMNNAAEAMTQGGKVILKTENSHLDRPIKGYEEVKSGDYVVLSVKDTGTGISPSDLERIFEPFYTRKKMGRSGTGLGTTVVWGTVKDHNGYIEVSSREGEGTVFSLYFPATREAPAKTEGATNLDSLKGHGESILIVDDVESQRELATAMLQELGYQATSVPGGEAAVEYLKDHSVDLVLLDMIMEPGMDGLATYERILEFNPRQKAIVVSGFSETERVKAFQKLRSGGYLKKPFLLEKLALAVKNELEK